MHNEARIVDLSVRSGCDLARLLDEHIAAVQRSRRLLPDVERLTEICVAALARGNKILFCGNGGSAADCQHIATELTVRFERERRALAAVALTTDSSALTAAANDFGTAAMFARQVAALGRPGDVLIAISTSGNSSNVVEALREARRQSVTGICLTGRDGGQARALADLCIAVPSDSTARIQEVHILFGHLLCAGIDAAFADGA